MHSRLTTLLSVAIVALVFSSTSATAQGTLTICKDGTRSAVSGRGACGGHGGVDAKATNAARKAAKAAKKAEERSETKAEKKAEKKAENAEKKIDNAEKKSAMVKCTDGTMSKGGRGACSRHGGIAK
jgi:hypothetical protein